LKKLKNGVKEKLERETMKKVQQSCVKEIDFMINFDKN
jgi:hypothetical protein